MAIDTNPFEATRATDFTDREILDYWVDLVGRDTLERLLKPSSAMPVLILGSKGSGKTHLLRYCSYPVRKLQWKGPAGEGVTADHYLGVYVHADGLNTSRFSNKSVDPDIWATVFQYYFESWFARLLIETVADAFGGTQPMLDEHAVVSRVLELFDQPPSLPAARYSDICDFLARQQRSLDFAINNASFTRELHTDILFSPGRLIFGIPRIIEESLGSARRVQVLYLIDELENFSDDQQRFINTLIRYRKGPASFRVGSRLYGVRTYDTVRGGEPIKQDAEYEVLPLDSWMRNSTDYPRCVRILCVKRLVQSGLLPSTQDHQKLAKELDQFFEVPSPRHHHRQETERLVQKYNDRGRPYFDKLRQQLLSIRSNDNSADAVDLIVKVLQVPEYALIEKLNILLLYQAWAKDENLVTAAQTIGSWSQSFLRDASSVPQKYRETLNHYKSDLLAQLYRDCRQPLVYAGLTTFISMSQGVPRNLLGILKHVFNRAAFNGEAPFRGNPISIASQRDGVQDAAAWLWDDAQPDRYGTEVRASVDCIAELFREVRFSDKPAECALSTFSVPTTGLTETALRTLQHAVNWSFLIGVPAGQKDKNKKSVAAKFQLNPLLAPRWGLSISRRGTIPLTQAFAESILDSGLRVHFKHLLRLRVSAMNAPFGRGSRSTPRPGQLDLDVDGP